MELVLGLVTGMLFGFGMDNRGICYRNLHSIGNDNIKCRICCSSVGILYSIAIIIRTIESVVGVLGIFLFLLYVWKYMMH